MPDSPQQPAPYAAATASDAVQPSAFATPSAPDAVQPSAYAAPTAPAGVHPAAYSAPSAPDATQPSAYAGTGDTLAAATLTVDPGGANNALVFTARAPGAGGNALSVRYVDRGAPGTLLVEVVTADGGTKATASASVTPGLGATLTINGRDYVYTPTAPLGSRQWVTIADLVAAINNGGLAAPDPDMSASGAGPITLTARSNGSAGNAITLAGAGGVVVSGANPTGGTDDTALDGPRLRVSLARSLGITTTAAQLLAAVEASGSADAVFAVSHAPGNDGTGIVAAYAPANLSGGAGIAPPAQPAPYAAPSPASPGHPIIPAV